MVRTDEVMTGIAHMPVRQHGPAMRAAIEQHMERAIIAAHQNHRLAANLECGEIALILYLAFMTSINPALVKDVVDFPNAAELVYIANLNELPPGLLKLCVASKSCFLKELQIAFVVIAILSP